MWLALRTRFANCFSMLQPVPSVSATCKDRRDNALTTPTKRIESDRNNPDEPARCSPPKVQFNCNCTDRRCMGFQTSFSTSRSYSPAAFEIRNNQPETPFLRALACAGNPPPGGVSLWGRRRPSGASSRVRGICSRRSRAPEKGQKMSLHEPLILN